MPNTGEVCVVMDCLYCTYDIPTVYDNVNLSNGC
jgi:hypothetical protein